jgi:prepilin signal peptidase PulO-like enzyme (type II secretory pathway)
MIAKIFVFIFGSIVGSFLNVCIHRLPKNESVVWPRSHCPKCQKRIPGYDNIPFVAIFFWEAGAVSAKRGYPCVTRWWNCSPLLLCLPFIYALV